MSKVHFQQKISIWNMWFKHLFNWKSKKLLFWGFFSVFFAGRYFDLYCVGRPQYKDFGTFSKFYNKNPLLSQWLLKWLTPFFLEEHPTKSWSKYCLDLDSRTLHGRVQTKWLLNPFEDNCWFYKKWSYIRLVHHFEMKFYRSIQ